MTGKPWPMDGSSDVLGGNNDLGAGLHTRSQWKKADHRGTLDRSVGEAAVAEWAGGAFLAALTWGPFVPGARSLVRRPLSLRYRKRPNTQAATAAETDSGPTPVLISDTKPTAVNRV